MQKYLICLLSLLSLNLLASEKKPADASAPKTLKERLADAFRRKKEGKRNFSQQNRILTEAKALVEKTHQESYLDKIIELQKNLKPHSDEIFKKTNSLGLPVIAILDAIKMKSTDIMPSQRKHYLQLLCMGSRALNVTRVHFAAAAVRLDYREEALAYVDTVKLAEGNPDDAVSFSEFQEPIRTPVQSEEGHRKIRRGTPHKIVLQ